jgi:hypothetical protein
LGRALNQRWRSREVIASARMPPASQTYGSSVQQIWNEINEISKYDFPIDKTSMSASKSATYS